MKVLNNLDGAKRIVQDSNNRMISDTEKTAITHANKTVIDALSDVAGVLNYNGAALGGGAPPNLSATVLTLGHYKLVFNSGTDKLEFQYSLT